MTEGGPVPVLIRAGTTEEEVPAMKIKGVVPGPIREHYINIINFGFYFTLKCFEN